MGMMTMQKTAGGIQVIPLETMLLEEGKIYISGVITDETTNRFVQQVMYLENKYPERPIHIFLNSRGGEVEAGLAIRDVLKGLEASGIEVNIYCVKLCASMAAILLASGPKKHRYILKSSKTMIHEPLIIDGEKRKKTSIQKTAESIMETKRRSVELLAADTGKSIEEVEKAISYDHFMNAEESVAFGLVDQIINRI